MVHLVGILNQNAVVGLAAFALRWQLGLSSQTWFSFREIANTDPQVRIEAANGVGDALRHAGHVVLSDLDLMGYQASALAEEILADQAIRCPNSSAVDSWGLRGYSDSTLTSEGSILTSVFDGVSYSPPLCMPATQKTRQRVQDLHSSLRRLAIFLLKLLAAIQAGEQGPDSIRWLGDAVNSGPQSSDGRRQILLRNMVYAGPPPKNRRGGKDPILLSDGSSPVWTLQGPHQDPSWISIILEKGDGLLTWVPNVQETPWVPVGGTSDSMTEGSSSVFRVVLLVGGRLSRASKGFYPAACHGVQAQDPKRLAEAGPRFSWAFLFTSNCCSYLDKSVRDMLITCSLSPAAALELSGEKGHFTADGVCEDASIIGCRVQTTT